MKKAIYGKNSKRRILQHGKGKIYVTIYVTSDTSKDSNADAHMGKQKQTGGQSAKVKAQSMSVVKCRL